MEFPLELRMAIEQKAQGFSTAELMREAQELSRRYREESGQGKRLSTTDRQALAYAAVRMPATFGAAAAAIGTHSAPSGNCSHHPVGCRSRYRRSSLGGEFSAFPGIGYLPGTGACHGAAGSGADGGWQRNAAKIPLDFRRHPMTQAHFPPTPVWLSPPMCSMRCTRLIGRRSIPPVGCH